MSQATRRNRFRDDASLLEALEGTDCSYCEGGELVRQAFKGNRAVVCTGCGTPAAQLW